MATKSFFLRGESIEELLEGVDWGDSIEEWASNDSDVHVFDENGEEIKDINRKDEYLRLFKFLIMIGKSVEVIKKQKGNPSCIH